MPFYNLNETPEEVATYSTAFGRVVSGQQLTVGYLRFKAHEGNEAHDPPMSNSRLWSVANYGFGSVRKRMNSGPARLFWSRHTSSTKSWPSKIPRLLVVRISSKIVPETNHWRIVVCASK